MVESLRKSLILSPVGDKLYFSEKYDQDNHWRYTDKLPREYETWVLKYSDFWPDPNTYDRIFNVPRGLKWDLIVDFYDNFKAELAGYDYIGCWDDDYAADIQGVNSAIQLARTADFPYWQQSLTSWTPYECLKNNPEWVFAETNFTEMGVTFFRADIFPLALKLFRDWRDAGPRSADWGQDKAMSFFLGILPKVVHTSSVQHMKFESSYDKTKAFQDMDRLFQWFSPHMLQKYGISRTLKDQQNILRIWKK